MLSTWITDRTCAAPIRSENRTIVPFNPRQPGSPARRGSAAACRLPIPCGVRWNTFKGMTDEMLEWQTRRFRELETSDDGYVVHVRPEQVVEIAFDGLQRSTRYPGGLALRFARVLRYRDDKTAAEADTIDAVRALAR